MKDGVQRTIIPECIGQSNLSSAIATASAGRIADTRATLPGSVDDGRAAGSRVAHATVTGPTRSNQLARA